MIDAKTYKVHHYWPIAPGKSASELAIDPKTMRLFASCDNHLIIVMNTHNGKVVTNSPIGDECNAVDFDKNLKQCTRMAMVHLLLLTN